MGADEALAQSRERVAPLLAPIAGGVGEDVSYDPLFESVKAEIDRLQSLEGGRVDWAAVVTNTEELLGDKSKDFRAACYYATAKPHTSGVEGLLDGLVVLTDLVAAFWEPMFPPLRRPKARANLLLWYSDTVGAMCGSENPGFGDRDVVLAADEVSKRLDADMRERLGDDYQGIAALREGLRELVRKLPEPIVEAPPPPPPAPTSQDSGEAPPSRPPPQASPAAPAPPPPAAAPTVSWPKTFESADAATEASNEISLCLTGVANALREADPANPAAYRIGRLGAWMLVHKPPASEGGVTRLGPPPAAVRASLEGLMASGEWLPLVHAADLAVGDHVFWLDANRFLSTAMDRLGALFINAKRALLMEVAVYLARVPEMADLAFKDGTPLADGPTKMWIDAEVKPILSAGGDGSHRGGSGGGAAFLDEPLNEARGLVASGKVEQALRVLHLVAAQAPSKAARFQAELATAKLSLQAGKPDVARAHLSGLEQHVAAHRLHEWDPELAASFYEALYQAAREENAAMRDVTAAALAREHNAFEWLCLLDPAAALKARG